MIFYDLEVKPFGAEEKVVISVPAVLYDEALKEKKRAGSHEDWCLNYRTGYTHKLFDLIDFIQNKLGKKIEHEIKRINLTDLNSHGPIPL